MLLYQYEEPAAGPQGAHRRCASVVLEGCADDVAWLSETLSREPHNCCAVDKAVDGGNGGGLGGKETPPLAEAGVGGENDGTLPVSGRDEAEQVIGGLGGERLIAKFVHEQYCRFHIPPECAFECSVGVGCVKLFDHVRSEYTENRVVGKTGGMSDGLCNACFALMQSFT